MITSVFVYGTLKRGQCRQQHWPATPLQIQVAWTRGTLFDRADYPAMIAGRDCVRGELWCFAADQIDRVIEALDQVEGTNQPGQTDLYLRVVTDVMATDNRSLGKAWTYHYAIDPTQHGFQRIVPDPTGSDPFRFVQWPAIEPQAR